MSDTVQRGPRHGIMMASIMLGTILQALDSTIAAVALPHMQGSFSATQEQVAWVLTSYVVASAIMTPMAGFLIDRIGRRALYFTAIGGFTLSSVLCGMATSLEEMVLFRILQGAFGAPLIPLAQSTMLDAYPPEKAGQAMAMFGMGVMFGPIIGPTLGAWLTEFYDWRWVFLINVPLGILALIGVGMSVGEPERNTERPFDLTGFALLSLAVGCFQLMLDRGNSNSWFQSTEIVIECVVALTCLYMFVVHILTRDHPFIDPGIFRDRNFSGAMVLSFVVSANMLSTMALLPPFLQNLLGYPVLTTGIVLAPRGIGTMIGMALMGRIMGRVDTRLILLAGLMITAGAIWEMSTFDRNVRLDALIITGVVQGFGLGFLFVPMSAIAFSTLAARLRAEASGIYNVTRNVGSSIGVSVMSGMLAVYVRENRSWLVDSVNLLNPAFQDPSITRIADITTAHGLAMVEVMVQQEAVMLGYVHDFRLMALATLAAIPTLLLLRDARPPAAPAAPAAPRPAAS